MTEDLKDEDHIPVLVSLSTLAHRWDVSPTTVRRLLEDADVPPLFLSPKQGGTIRYSLEDIEHYLEEAQGRPAPSF